MPVLIGSFDVQNLKIQIIKFFPFLLPAKIMVLKGNFPTKILTNMNEPYQKSRTLFDKMESQSIILLRVKMFQIFSSDKETETEETH